MQGSQQTLPHLLGLGRKRNNGENSSLPTERKEISQAQELYGSIPKDLNGMT